MKSKELLNELIATADGALASRFIQPDGSVKTCDCIKAGDPDREIRKAAVTMFPTHDVIKEAVEYGAELLIVHEPLYYDHWDRTPATPLAVIKEKYVEQSGLTIFRFHDHAHSRANDLIYDGEMRLLGLKGHIVSHPYAQTDFVLDEPMTAMELAKLAEEKLGAEHVRIAGCTDKPGTRICCAFGGGVNAADVLEDNDFIICGELIEWRDCEYVRDYAQFGYNKAVIVLTHEVSERAGMQLLTEELAQRYPDIEFKYLESGAVYKYTDAQN